MIKNYIFDFGQVIVKYVPRDMAAPFAENEEDLKILAETVFDRRLWDRLDDGTITEDEVKAGFTANLPERLRETGLAVYDHWMENAPIIEDVARLTRDIKSKGYKLYMLSNLGSCFSAKFPVVPHFRDAVSVFDGIVISGEIGMIKPDAAIYEYLLNKYDLRAEECVFIDDSEKNITGAEAVGIQGILYDGNAETLRKALGF